MIARASSGSRCCSSSVDPLMSAKSAVTVLRSPSSADVSEEVPRVEARAAESGAPQSAQNFALGALSEPHFEHRFDKGLPHSAQNFLPGWLSVPHFEQRIAIIRLEGERPPIITGVGKRLAGLTSNLTPNPFP